LTLTIVIVSFNARDDLAAALDSLVAHPPAVAHEIVVVDNASTEDVPAMLRTRFPGVRVIEAGGNLGFARANNLGIRQSRGDLVLLLNPDTIVPAGAIDRLVRQLLATPEAVAAGPRLVDSGGEAELSFGRTYTPWSEAARKVTLTMQAQGVGLVRRGIARATSREQFVDWVSGACLLVRRAAGDRAGWLDERYFMYAEDVDFCAALRADGGKVLFTPAAEIVHRRGRSGASRPGPTQQAWRESHLAFYRKHLPRWAPWLERYLRWRRH
jgi:N-acetylglucosaminyl-diphospho-decaprenol L-rhamnosyltransferase